MNWNEGLNELAWVANDLKSIHIVLTRLQSFQFRGLLVYLQNLLPKLG